MNKKTRVTLPVNTTYDELELFKPYSSYKYLLPKVKYVKRAFITSTGLVCNSRGFIKESCHKDWNQQPEVCFAQACQFYYDAEKDPTKLLTFDDDETYLVIHPIWYHNYFHWLNESLYRLWLVKDKAHQMILLLPAKSALPQFALDSLQLFTFKNIIHIPDNKSALVRTLCLPVQKPIMARYNSDALLHLNKLYVDHVKKNNINVNTIINERIYISRKNAPRRKIVNEEEVIKTLSNYDFTILYSESLTFFEQVALFSNVKYLVSSHGAGLTNMLFMTPGATIFEFHKRKINPTRHENLLFWYMADAMGHKYYHQICEPINEDELFYTADVTVDIDLLNKNLELIFAKS